MSLQIPPGLLSQVALGPPWVSWLDRLPGLAAELIDEWALAPDGASMHGYCSLVLPVRTERGFPCMLKISFDGDDESLHEGLALQHWAGRGAVRLVRADPHRRALLLERLSTDNLNGVGELEACEIVAGLYPRLHLPALPQLRTVTSYVERWLATLAELSRQVPMPRRLIAQALSLGRDLVADPASVGRIVHGDLHHENVLAGDREPWLAIDPKPMSGDPHYEPAPMLWNRWDEMVSTGDLRTALRRRFHTLVDAAGLDEDRARDWVVVRMVLNASWSVEDAVRLDRRLDEGDRDWITRCITMVKAVQD